MLQINKDKGPKEQRKLCSREIRRKIGNTQEKDRNKYEIYKLLFFLISILIVIITKISLKCKRPIIKDTFFFFDNVIKKSGFGLFKKIYI